MSFLTFNGVAVDVDYGSFKEEIRDSGDLFQRTLSGRMAEARGARSRSWSFRTTTMLRDDAEKLRDWIEGRGQCWNFDSSVHTYSGAGVTNTAASTYTRSASSGKYGGKLQVGSGSQFGVDMSNKLGRRRGWLPADDWTAGFWRNFIAGETASAGFHGCILKSSTGFTQGVANPPFVKQYVDGVLNNSANLGNVFQVQSTTPFVAIYGKKTDNTNVAIDYDDFFFVPFEVPDSWVAQIHAFMAANAFSALPRMKIAGDAIPDASPVEVIARCHEIEMSQEVASGALQNNMRVLQVQVEEW